MRFTAHCALPSGRSFRQPRFPGPSLNALGFCIISEMDRQSSAVRLWRLVALAGVLLIAVEPPLSM